MSKPENGVSCRYQEALNGTWYLTVYGAVGSPPLAGNWSGDMLDLRPEWLLPILDVAAAADAFIKPVDPPPYRVLWFRIDHEYNLIGFGRD
jgi:hypothetical protein